ncbi:MAG: glycerol-3-phosphate dehydrogenase [Desulfuromonas sp.]|nr:MAG: glycerol-3-phosphate dehydrogenase [Desulfuromonas sp.]
MPTSHLHTPRERDPARLARQRFDALIIGGGINGAGIARDLALRGLRVALVEQGDYASGTSSASTKLVHGGLRYLENFDLRLVFEASRERRILTAIAPHLVRPIPFFIPVYENDPRSLLTVRAGMLFYDALALLRNTYLHSILSADEAFAREPALQRDGLKGVAVYWDCRMDDARLCLENVLAAHEMGAETVNYCRVLSLLRCEGKVVGAEVQDEESGSTYEVEAHIVINAAGPWLDAVCGLDGEEPGKLRPSRGSHILVPRINRGDEAIYLSSGSDARLFFVIPWGNLSLIGTTDITPAGDPGETRASEADIDYLLAESARHLQGVELDRSHVVAAFSGVRPLVSSEGAIGKASREHQIFTSASGMISVGGGKYTTYRAVAAEVAAKVCAQIGKGEGRSLTDRVPLPGGSTGRIETYLQRAEQKLGRPYGLPPAHLAALVNRYGSRAPLLLQRLQDDPALLRPVAPGSSLLTLQVLHAIDYEQARTPEDILRRRTTRALESGRGLHELEAIADLLASRFAVSPARRQQWCDDYRRRVALSVTDEKGPTPP